MSSSPTMVAQVVNINAPAMIAEGVEVQASSSLEYVAEESQTPVASFDTVDPHFNHASQAHEQTEAATRDPVLADSEHVDGAAGSQSQSLETSASELTSSSELSSTMSDVQIGKTYMSLDVGTILEKHRIQNEEAICYIDRSTHSISAQKKELDECMICLDNMAPGHVASSLPCGHTFHHECISNWLQTKLVSGQTGCCPSCNLRIIVPVLAPNAENAEIVVQVNDPAPATAAGCSDLKERAQRNPRTTMTLAFVLILIVVLCIFMM